MSGDDEKSVLLRILDGNREAILAKVAGVPEPEVRTPGVPSGTNLLGLVKHLTAVERFYLLGEDRRSWAATFRPRRGETVDEVVAGYREATRRANEVIAAWADLAAPGPRPARRGPVPSMRWTLVHMIEETARHAGQADILRERIDGATGT